MNGKSYRTIFTAGLLASGLLAATAGSAEAFGRQVTVTGLYGHGYTKTVDHSCADGTCSTQSQLQTYSGAEVSGSRSCTYVAPGQYSCAGVVTGPQGNTASHSASVFVVR